MSEINSNVRYKLVTTTEATDIVYLDDANSDVPKAITVPNFFGSFGITNTAVNGQLYMQNNATATVISATNTFYKVFTLFKSANACSNRLIKVISPSRTHFLGS